MRSSKGVRFEGVEIIKKIVTTEFKSIPAEFFQQYIEVYYKNANGYKERTKHKVANQTRRHVKNLTIILTNKKQKVQTIVLVNITMSVKWRRKYA